MKIKVFKEEIKLPTKSYKGDIGWDVYCLDDFEIEPFETKTLDLGFGVQVPEGYACMLVPRSSTAKKGLISQGQIIDPNYRGEIHLIITNCSKQTYQIKKDDRLVALVVYKILPEDLRVCTELDETDRGTRGLGSSGK